jgi:hypothetical protein
LASSATIRLASTANLSPLTRPAAIQVWTTPSQTRRNTSFSQNRSRRARRRIFRHLVFDRQSAKLAIGEVHLHVAAQRLFRGTIQSVRLLAFPTFPGRTRSDWRRPDSLAGARAADQWTGGQIGTVDGSLRARIDGGRIRRMSVDTLIASRTATAKKFKR